MSFFWFAQDVKETRTTRPHEAPGSTLMMPSALPLAGKLVGQTEQVTRELAITSLLQLYCIPLFSTFLKLTGTLKFQAPHLCQDWSKS